MVAEFLIEVAQIELDIACHLRTRTQSECWRVKAQRIDGKWQNAVEIPPKEGGDSMDHCDRLSAQARACAQCSHRTEPKHLHSITKIPTPERL